MCPQNRSTRLAPGVLRFLTDLPLIAYNVLIVAVSPVLLLLKALRYWGKRRSREFEWGRWACPVITASQSHPTSEAESRPHVVFCGTGFGEIRIVEELCAALKEACPEVRTTWATRDREVVRSVNAAHPDQAVTFMPFDFVIPALNWLRHLSPDVVVLVEKFWFPNLIRCSADWGAKVVVANGRTRSHESLRYKLIAPFHRWILSGIKCMCFPSEQDLARLRPVLPSGVDTRVTGNIKFSLRPAPDPTRTQALADWLADRSTLPLLAAGSTGHAEEEAFVLRAFEIVRRELPCALLLAPRRLHRVPECLEVIASFNLKTSLRTQPNPGAEVYVLDTMGELATAYQFAVAAFIGGTLTGAGHNVVEPLVWGVPASYGPMRGFFESVQRACEAAGVGFRIRSPEELAAHWLTVLKDPNLREQLCRNAKQLLQQQAGALTQNAEAIAELADAVESS